jgi:cytochrome P450
MQAASAASGLKPFQAIPVMPGGRRLVGHLPLIRDDRMTFIRLGAESPHPMLRVESPVGTVVMVTTPDLFHEALVERHGDYVKSAMMRFTLAPIANEGLFTASGELWKRQRRLMAPMFHASVLKGYADDMTRCARRAVEGWVDGQRVEFMKETTRITMAVAGRTFFDSDTDEDTERLSEAITTALDWGSHQAGTLYSLGHIVPAFALARAADHLPGVMADPARALSEKLQKPLFFPGAEGRRLREAVEVLESRVRAMIAERRAQGLARPDLLTRLLAARDEENGGAAVMTDQQVRDEATTLFVAGHETTATSLSWSFYLLGRHPAVREAVQREVDALPRPRDLRGRGMSSLPLTTRVFKEAMRLYPPVPIYARRLLVDAEIRGVAMPRGTTGDRDAVPPAPGPRRVPRAGALRPRPLPPGARGGAPEVVVHPLRRGPAGVPRPPLRDARGAHRARQGARAAEPEVPRRAAEGREPRADARAEGHALAEDARHQGDEPAHHTARGDAAEDHRDAQDHGDDPAGAVRPADHVERHAREGPPRRAAPRAHHLRAAHERGRGLTARVAGGAVVRATAVRAQGLPRRNGRAADGTLLHHSAAYHPPRTSPNATRRGDSGA